MGLLSSADADVVREPDNSQVGGTIILQGPSVAILIVLRVIPESGTEPAVTADIPEETGQQLVGPRPREFVVFVKQARPAVGAAEHRELPWGHIDNDGLFVGPSADVLLNVAGLRFNEYQMEDMTSLALSARRAPPRIHSLGIALDPASLDERVRLYLYRETVNKTMIETLQRSGRPVTNGTAPSKVVVDLQSLNDAWRMTSDAKSLSALFLFHELKYHQLMPRYRAPREVKKAAIYTNVSDLNPNLTGRNLRVKVVGAVEMVPRADRPGQERGIVLVGDATGVVKVALDASQLGTFPQFKSPGAAIFLRNIQFDMTDGHMHVILDSFGKVATPTPEELATQFTFQPSTSPDMSATEYEKFIPGEVDTAITPDYPQQQTRGSQGGYNRGVASTRAMRRGSSRRPRGGLY